jgi:phospholipase A1
MFVLPVRWSNNPNERKSGNTDPDYIAPAGVDTNIETKFQLSFKTKVLQSIFWGHGDLWLAYTQNHIGKSIIMRFHAPLEVNYEPNLF